MSDRQGRYNRELRSGPDGSVARRLAEAAQSVVADDSSLDAERLDIAANVLGPLLVGYALWVGGLAVDSGVQRLYYVARDGEVMLRVAAPILARLAPSIECRYLYGSRQPMMLSTAGMDEDIFAEWTRVATDFTLRSTLARFDLEPTEFFRLAPGLLELAEQEWDRALSADERSSLSDALRRPPLIDKVREASAHAAHITTDYLRQEGLADGVPSALVDAGWNGNTGRSVDLLLAAAGASSPQHYMLGVFAPAARARELGVALSGWLFDDSADDGEPPTEPWGPNVLIEMLCAGSHGRALGYTRTEKGIVPVLASGRNDAPLDWGLDQVHDVAAEVAARYLESATEADLGVDLSAVILRQLKLFWLEPTRAEALAWGNFPWEEEIWPPYNPVAHRVTTVDVARRLMRGERRLRRHNSWRAGSAAVSGQPWRWLLQRSNREQLRRAGAGRDLDGHHEGG